MYCRRFTDGWNPIMANCFGCMDRLDLLIQLWNIRVGRAKLWRFLLFLQGLFIQHWYSLSKPFQFACQHSILRQAIARAIMEDMAILDTTATRLEKLILDPISETATFLPSRHVVVSSCHRCIRWVRRPDDVASNVMNLFIPSLPVRWSRRLTDYEWKFESKSSSVQATMYN